MVFVTVLALIGTRSPSAGLHEYLSQFDLIPVVAPNRLLLKKGDVLAICGDSITEQKMYSKIMETYLTACVPQLEIRTRQFGWSGETAPGLSGRMEKDILVFKPTIATTCYGMNDHRYRRYDSEIGQTYTRFLTQIVQKFKAANARVVVGSAGSVGNVPNWAVDRAGGATREDLNKNLARLRNLAYTISKQENVYFADLLKPMLAAGFNGSQIWPKMKIEGNDGVHPGMAGHLVMAYSFLKNFGLDGEVGAFTVDLGSKRATASSGHIVKGFDGSTLQLASSRYPYYFASGGLGENSSADTGLALVPFMKDLNRFTLKVARASGPCIRIQWGSASKTFTASQASSGINLAEEFRENPLSGAFREVEMRVARKQQHDTVQMKQTLRSEEAKTDYAGVFERSERIRAGLEDDVRRSVVPVVHELKITVVKQPQ